jgi:hypothetical protein
VDFTLRGMSTECLIPVWSPTTRRTITGLSCLPRWLKDGPDGNTGNPLRPRFPVDEVPITVAVPDALYDVAQAAFTAWETALEPSIGLDFVLVRDGTCASTNEHCIMIGEGILNMSDPLACGTSKGSGLSGGVYTNRADISLKPGLSNGAFKTWVIGHELGHLLGLLDALPTECATDSSVMRTLACNTTPPAGAGLATVNDGIPVLKSIYGSGPTKTCGWNQ